MTRLEEVVEFVRRRIAGGELATGARLPSIRKTAGLLGVSVSTVVEAYARLAADGSVRSRPGSGFYVAAHSPPLSLEAVGPRLDRSIDPLWVSRQSLELDETSLKPGCGWLPTSWMPVDNIRRSVRALSRGDGRGLTDYGTPAGPLALRQLLSRRLWELNIEAAPGQLVVTDSGTQALDLLCRFLLKPGDSVLVDDPCYFNFLALLRAHGARIVGVPYTPSGPDLEQFERALTEHRPRLYITTSGPQNPTGATMSPKVAHRLLKLAEQYDLLIVEDDIFSDLEPEPGVKLAAFDGLDRVVHVSSFSKTISASMRCGYLALRSDWVDGIVDLKIAATFSGGFSSEVVFAVLKDGGYRKYLRELQDKLAQAAEVTRRRLEHIGIVPWVVPQAGMFLWCRLPDGLDAAEVARRALEKGVVLAPGNVFSVSQSAPSMMRFNPSQCDDESLFVLLEEVMSEARASR